MLRRRFGFSPYDETVTLDEIGKVYGVTRERIRQIESKALKKLRDSLRARGWVVPDQRATKVAVTLDPIAELQDSPA